MAKHVEEKPEGAPEWMVSFADMITIMMSFFVIMFALAAAKNEGHAEAVRQSIHDRFSPYWSPLGAVQRGLFTEGSPFRSRGTKGKTPESTPRAILYDDAAAGRMGGRANIPTLGFRAGLGGSVYFEEMSTELSANQRGNLKSIAERMVGKPQKIQIIGHASRRPLPADSPYHDQWDLAYARGRHVMDLLISMGIEADRIRLGSAGDTEPIRGLEPGLYARRASRVDLYLTDIFVTQFDPADEGGSELR